MRSGLTKTQLIKKYNALVRDPSLKLSLVSPIKKGHVLMLIMQAERWQKGESDTTETLDSMHPNH